MMNSVSLCYYPTTTIFLDDHRPFLDSLPLSLDDGIAHRAFTTAVETIEFTKAAASHRRLCDQLYTLDEGGRLTLDAQTLRAGLPQAARFAELSVLVADYGMPDMNGLDVCRAIEHPHIKKILLTGMADEGIGRAALQDGTIDNYIAKSAGDAFARINDLIAEYQRDYFTTIIDLTRLSADDGAATLLNALAQPDAAQCFWNLCRAHNIAEYYLQPDPLGFILVGTNGAVSELLINSERDIPSQLEGALNEWLSPAALIAPGSDADEGARVCSHSAFLNSDG